MVMRAGQAVGRRGSMYIAVLGVSAVVTAMALGAFMAVRVQGTAEAALTDAVAARYNAESGFEVLTNNLDSNTTWRSRPQGTWLNSVALERGAFTVDVTDPVDGNFANRPYDPLLVRSRGVQGSATHLLEVQVQPTGIPIGALAAAVAAAGEVRVSSGRTLNLNGGVLSTNGTMNNSGAVLGVGHCSLSLGLGSFSGGVLLLQPAKSMPPSTVQALYTSLGTALPSVTTISQKVLGPGVNTAGGGTNAEGIYVLSSSSDITITASRIHGTLVINAPGRVVTITGPVHISPARPDYPCLIVNARLVLQADKSVALSEAAQAVNFNPAGMPYAGATNATTTDSYPTELRGLVHCRDEVTLQGNTLIRGCLITENTGSNAFQANDAEVVYDASLFTTPPMGYITAELLRVKPGTWKQVVLP